MPKVDQRKKTPAERSEALKIRMGEVEKMLAIQLTSSDIQKRIVEKYGVSARCVRNDIMRVYKKWDVESEAERPARRSQLRMTLRRLLQMALKGNDVRAAILVADRLAKLDGLFAPVEAHVQHSGSVRMAKMTSDDKRKQLFSLLDEYEPGDDVLHTSKDNGHPATH